MSLQPPAHRTSNDPRNPDELMSMPTIPPLRRQLGTTGLEVTELGLGCQSLGGGLFHRDDTEAVRTVQQAIDTGINFFDVSDHHSLGIAESLLGRAFKGRRDQVLITTKGGYTFTRLGTFSLGVRYFLRPVSGLLRPLKRPLHLLRASQGRANFSPQYLRAAVERSLARLQTDHIDLYQLYKPTVSTMRDATFAETLALLEELKQQGKIRHYGIACQWVEEAMQCLDLPGISTVQVAVNLIEPEATHGLISRAAGKGLGVIARHPRAIGLLTNAGSDIMGDTSYYDQYRSERARRAADFRFLITPQRTLSQASIRYVLDIAGIATVIPRAVNRRELTENCSSLSAPGISEAEYRRIGELQAPWLATTPR
jgi:aryl-alcohol dehydrogenase-like predicted oxidoreductase